MAVSGYWSMMLDGLLVWVLSDSTMCISSRNMCLPITRVVCESL